MNGWRDFALLLTTVLVVLLFMDALHWITLH